MAARTTTKKKVKASSASTSASTTTPSSSAAPSYHHGDLRRALLEAARAELHAVGRDALSLRAVARRAGVSHTAAYHHFTDKAALLGEIAADGFVALDVAMREAIAQVGDDALARVRAAGHGYLAMAWSDPAAYDLMFNGCDMTSSPRLREVGPLSFLRLCAVVADARAAAGLADGDDGSDVLGDALLLWEAVHGCAMLKLAGHLDGLGLTPAQHVDRLLRRLSHLFRR